MTEVEKQKHDKQIIDKEVKRFLKRLKDLEPKLLHVIVTDVQLKIEEKPHLKIQSFAAKIMSI